MKQNVRRDVRNLLIDSQLQIKYTLVLVVAVLAVGLALGALLFRTSTEVLSESGRVVERSRELTAQSRKLLEETQKVTAVARMNFARLGLADDEFLSTFDTEDKEREKATAAQVAAIERQEQAAIAQQMAIVERQRTMTAGVAMGLLALVLLVGIFGIVFTHKVAGPSFKMRRMFAEVRDGSLDVRGELRRGDELKELFLSFQQMVESLRATKERELSLLDEALTAMQASNNVAPSSLEALEEVRASLKKSLHPPGQ